MELASGNEAAGEAARQSQNRYAHLVTSSKSGATQTRAASSSQQNNNNKRAVWSNQISSNQMQLQEAVKTKPTAPTLSQQHQQEYRNNYYYNSFSAVDWREQWTIIKERILDKVEEPQVQRKLILFIVCCALLLDNMLYMVIVPIIPDYLRSIDAWSTYAENANWVRRNVSGSPKWERVGGNLIYEGEDSAVGFLFASKAIVQLFINPFSGAIIDRIGYELPMMIGLTVMFFSTMVFACGQTYSILFLARSLQGVGSAFADTSGLAMIADRFTEENERQRALGVALAFISFGCLVAPPFGAVLYQAAGKEVPFIILSLVCLLDGSLLLLVTPPGTFAQLLPSYRPMPTSGSLRQQQQQQSRIQQVQQPELELESATPSQEERKKAFQRQKSTSRRHSMTVASAGEAPKGTPIYVLFRDPCIACCAGALVIANVSLAFLEPTISIWIQNTMPDIEEWQMGMIWLPAFVPHVLGVYSTVKLADKYPRYQWLITAIGLLLEGLSCLMVPFCSSFWSLIIPISIICFGLALIDTAILPTLGFLVDTRYVSVYGSIYAIADISYSLSYAVGPIIAGGIVEAIGFTALNFLIAIVTVGYTPILMMLRSIHDYEPFEIDQSGLERKKAKEAQPFGSYGRAVTDSDEEACQERAESDCEPGKSDACSRYETPKWADQPAPNAATQQQQTATKSVLSKKTSIRQESSCKGKHTVTIVEDLQDMQRRVVESKNPFAEH